MNAKNDDLHERELLSQELGNLREIFADKVEAWRLQRKRDLRTLLLFAALFAILWAGTFVAWIVL